MPFSFFRTVYSPIPSMGRFLPEHDRAFIAVPLLRYNPYALVGIQIPRTSRIGIGKERIAGKAQK